MNRKKKTARAQPRLYRSDDLLEILTAEIPVRERGLLEVLSLLARRKILVNPQASLRRPVLSDDPLSVSAGPEKREGELEEDAADWRIVFAEVCWRMEQLSRRIEQVAATPASEMRGIVHSEAEPAGVRQQSA